MRRLMGLMLVLALCGLVTCALGEDYVTISGNAAAGEAWYQEMLQASQLSLGNNSRLLRVIERARAGEKITVATIGGSITEGAGASRYGECYASRVWQGFAELYGAGDGSNVSFVNAGVGGTPSTFGLMRYQRDVEARVKDDDGLPDLVLIEFAVNDGGEPTKHRCYESLVKHVLSQPNEPAVILVFSVFESGFTLQQELAPIGERWGLMMVSLKDSAFPRIGSRFTAAEYFSDPYHPTTMGHGIMADCILSAIQAAAAAPRAEADIDPEHTEPVYGTDFTGLTSIFGDSDLAALGVDVGSFGRDDTGSYRNMPVGRVCGQNFMHTAMDGDAPLTFTATFKNLLISYRNVSNDSYGRAEVWVDGMRAMTLQGNGGGYGQSETVLAYNWKEAREHTVVIRMKKSDADKRFTVTCIAFTP